MNALPATRSRTETLPSIDARALLAAPMSPVANGAIVVDLRSPSEFERDHVPGAYNVPLFGDLDRALVGTLYRQASPGAAFEEARQIVSTRIEGLVRTIAEAADWRVEAADVRERVWAMTSAGIERLEAELALAPAASLPERPVALHCWRGGLRSRSVVALVRALGLDRAVVLAGGYKAYRAEVARELAGWRPPRTFVLRGLTGVGKTLVLRELACLRPDWTIDLEALAGHRSSLLGMVGLEPCSQKAFESRLAARVRAGPEGFGGPLVVEGESRKVGDVFLPLALWGAMSEGVSIELVAPVERRIAVLEQDYLASPASRAQLLERLPSVEARMERAAGAPPLATMLERGEVDALVRLLLERYYDPLYRHGERGRGCALRVDASEPARAAREIAEWIDGAAIG